MSTVERKSGRARRWGTWVEDGPRLSVVIPCLNEAEGIATCVAQATEVMAAHGIDGEVIVVDNGSEDGSAGLAAATGAEVVLEPRRGYGSAYLAGFAAARGATSSWPTPT